MIKQIKTHVRTERHTRLQLSGTDIRLAIARHLEAEGMPDLPRDAKLFVLVPGGGDWSNTSLDLDEYPIHVEWTIIEEEDDE